MSKGREDGFMTAGDDVCAGHEGGRMRRMKPLLTTVLEKEREKEWKKGRTEANV